VGKIAFCNCSESGLPMSFAGTARHSRGRKRTSVSKHGFTGAPHYSRGRPFRCPFWVPSLRLPKTMCLGVRASSGRAVASGSLERMHGVRSHPTQNDGLRNYAEAKRTASKACQKMDDVHSFQGPSWVMAIVKDDEATPSKKSPPLQT
jgi:hypothetical protein